MRPKLLTITGLAAAGALALLAGSQTWISFMLDGTHSLESVAGHDVNSAVSPIAIAIFAAALALTIAGRVFRRVLGALIVLLGAGLAALTISVVVRPLEAITGTITSLTGITGANTTSLVVWSQLSAWVWVCVAAGVIAALLGVTVVVWGGRWVTGGRKYDASAPTAATAAGQPDRISDWDALSGGDDPSDDEDLDADRTPDTDAESAADDDVAGEAPNGASDFR
ncbi:Trp biosynthesis-associated membrane protein [Leucobacter japonicus]|uniref:Trp biosynthesis-associated membrane protein n=1 Tax=Leucobacter japonicus TaxID=1461259 RepID=UPI0009E5BFF9|nr:Trp biosynthesis-associated membrane protein [Leucobacter japonicus]